jgi:uncharacterized protein (TIGR03067 family)
MTARSGTTSLTTSILAIDDDTLIFREDKDTKLAYTIDPTKKPKTLDMRDPADPNAKIHAAIYELEGDTLRLCMCDKPGKSRPTEFSGAKEKDTMLLVFSRKPAE